MKPVICEFLGTFTLVLFGTGAIIVGDLYPGTIDHLGVSIAFGTVVMIMIYSFGHISGAHINPAVTLAFYVAGLLPRKRVLPYIMAQCIAALSASFLLSTIFPDVNHLGETLPHIGMGPTFAMEVILTFILMLVIIQVSTGSKEVGTHAAIAVGATVMLEALFAGPLTGASMNPARSLGPALVQGNLTGLWIYLIAPTLGAALVIPIWTLLKPTQR